MPTISEKTQSQDGYNDDIYFSGNMFDSCYLMIK